MSNQEEFIKKTQTQGPISHLKEIVQLLLEVENKKALDLGCGAGVDARYLVEQGFRVDAVDNSEIAINSTKELTKGFSVNIIQENIENYEIKENEYALIIAWNILSFLPKEKAEKIIENIKKGLQEKGIMVLSIFGAEDERMKQGSKLSFWSANEIKERLAGMEFIKFIEEKKERPDMEGDIKVWHVIKIIAQKQFKAQGLASLSLNKS